MAGSKQWSSAKKARKTETWTKARKRAEARGAASKGDNVAPGTYNGHSVGGYCKAKQALRAEKRAA